LSGFLTSKIDRRFVMAGLYLAAGFSNFCSGPSKLFNLPDEVYMVYIGQSILGIATGGVIALIYPEISDGINSVNFTAN